MIDLRGPPNPAIYRSKMFRYYCCAAGVERVRSRAKETRTITSFSTVTFMREKVRL